MTEIEVAFDFDDSQELTDPRTPRITVSHSEVESYLRCERQWFYGYGLEIERIGESNSLFRGKLGHACLEIFFRYLMEHEQLAERDFDDVFETARELSYKHLFSYMSTHATIVAEITECFEFFYKQYPFRGWKILGVEYEQQLVVNQTLIMPFIIDLVAQDPFGDIWIIDHKFMYDFITDRDSELMPQLPKYFVGMKHNGYDVDKMAYSVLRYRKIKAPTPEKYRFIPFGATNTRLKQTITEQVIVSDRIQQAKALPLEVLSGQSMRTANKMVCNSCSFRTLCVAELNDWQPNLILNSDYQKKVRREFKEIEQQ